MKYLLSLLTMVFIFSCNTHLSDSMIAGGLSDEQYPEPACYDNCNEKYTDYGENPFKDVAEEPVSTFSVDADGGSYANSRRYLSLGQRPPTAAVRIEEFINYFTFDYKEPEGDENISIESEIASCPWQDDHHLLRFGIKGRSVTHEALPDANFVFLIDVSGSMNAADKLGILKSGFKMLTDSLRDNDRVAIVTYAGSAGVLLQSTNGDEKSKIKQAIDQLGAGGSTAGAAGIHTAYEIAQQYFIPDGNNRVILGSDGDFNVGPSSTDDLVALIEEKRKSGIYLTVLGVGSGNLNDAMMEQLANKGNGTYEYIDNSHQLQKIFIEDRERFFSVAVDAKIQVTFNEKRIGQYRLIGYENRALSQDDFTNDTVDAGEIGAGQTITAVYEVIIRDTTGEEEFAQFDFRYKKPGENESRLITHQVIDSPVLLSDASENMRFCSGITTVGLLFKDSEYRGEASMTMAIDLIEDASTFDPSGFRNELRGLLVSMPR